MKIKPCVAILNGETDLLDIVQEALEEEDFAVVTELTSNIKLGKIKFSDFIKRVVPDVLICDIPPPYDINLDFFRQLIKSENIEESRIIFTTTNQAKFKEITGEIVLIEMVGKPFDLTQLINRVREKLHRQNELSA